MKTRDQAAQAALAWLCLATTPAMAAAPLNPVLGHVDGITTTGSGEVLLVGWACNKGWSWSSPQVDVYAGAPAGQGGTKLGVYRTDQPSEAAVSQHCETSGINHRFAITLTISMRQQFAGKALYVYGFAMAGQGNNILLNGSGQYTVPAAPAVADSVYYIHADRLGSNVVMTDANARVVARTEYTAYGAAAQNTNKNETAGYTGHYEDPLTGLTYMQARYYDADLGRFISIDPVGAIPGDLDSFGRYSYANDNPITFTDPDGRMASACRPTVTVAGGQAMTDGWTTCGFAGGGGALGAAINWAGGIQRPPSHGGGGGGRPIANLAEVTAIAVTVPVIFPMIDKPIVHDVVCSKGMASVAGATAGGFVSGGLTGMANGRSPLAAFGGAVSGAVFAGGGMALTKVAGPYIGNASSSTVATAATAYFQDRSPSAVATNGFVTYVASKFGANGGPGLQLTERAGAYVGLTSVANRGLGGGAAVAGPMFGLAGAFTDTVVENSWNHYCGN